MLLPLLAAVLAAAEAAVVAAAGAVDVRLLLNIIPVMDIRIKQRSSALDRNIV